MRPNIHICEYMNRHSQTSADLACAFITNIEQQTSDDAALNAIIDQILAVKDIDGKLFVDTTTVHPSTTRDTNEKLKKLNASFVAGK